MSKLKKMVTEELFYIHQLVSKIDSVTTLKEDLGNVEKRIKALKDAVQLTDTTIKDNSGFNEVRADKDEATYLFKDSADVVTEVIAKYSPREVKITTPKEALEWYAYLTNCNYTPKLELAKTILFNYIEDNLKN